MRTVLRTFELVVFVAPYESKFGVDTGRRACHYLGYGSSLGYCNFKPSDTSASRELIASTTEGSGGLSPLSSIWMLNLS